MGFWKKYPTIGELIFGGLMDKEKSEEKPVDNSEQQEETPVENQDTSYNAETGEPVEQTGD